MAPNVFGQPYQTVIKPSDRSPTHLKPHFDPKLSPRILVTHAPNATVQERILEELCQLNQIQANLATKQPLAMEAMWTYLLQILALIFGTVFGVFSILAWQAACQANSLSDQGLNFTQYGNGLSEMANKMMLVNYCQQSTTENGSLCLSIQAAASMDLSSYVSEYYPELQTRTSAPPTSATMPTHTGTNTTTTATPKSTATPTTSSAPPKESKSTKNGVIATLAILFTLALIFGGGWWHYSIWRAKRLQSLKLQKSIITRPIACSL